MTTNTIMPPLWDETVSLTRARPGNGARPLDELDADEGEYLKRNGYSSLVCFIFTDGTVMAFRDYDDRKTKDGKYRPTRGTFKTTMGFGWCFPNVFAPGSGIDVSSYQVTREFQHHLKPMEWYYQMNGDGWGVAILPYLCEVGLKEKFLLTLNRSAYDNPKTRFREFTALPIDMLIDATNCFGDQEITSYPNREASNAVIRYEGMEYVMWDEKKQYDNLFPKLLQDERLNLEIRV